MRLPDRGTRWAVLRRTAAEISADRVSVVASGVAFRVALAAFPGIALLVWLAQRAAGPDDARALAHTLSSLLPDVGRSVVDDAARGALRDNPVDGRAEAPWLGGYAPLAGLAFALWSANAVAGARWLRWPALFLGFAPALALLYRFAPNRGRERWPLVTVGSTLVHRTKQMVHHRFGASRCTAHRLVGRPVQTDESSVWVGPLAALLLVLNAALFSAVARHLLSLGPTYGSLSAVAAFLLWLWAAMLAVLCCAELDSEIERGTGLYGLRAGGP